MRLWFVVLLVLVCGCVTPGVAPAPPSIESFTVPSQVYHSRENMNITVVVNAGSAVENATLKVYGINSRYYRLDQSRKLNLTYGANTISIDYATPQCFGCAGISPGRYNVTAELYVNEQAIDNRTIEIDIQQ
ncbi:hypothetical protein KJ969_05330 [Patescibacteria group bacterium]|nr:hypothetical protein [Patescibacteria group bacterium]